MEDLKLHDYDEYEPLSDGKTETEQASMLYSRLMNVTPYSPRGGTNLTPPHVNNRKKNTRKRRIQKQSRKKNR